MLDIWVYAIGSIDSKDHISPSHLSGERIRFLEPMQTFDLRFRLLGIEKREREVSLSINTENSAT